MSLSIRDPRATILARELAARRGTNMTEAIVTALESALRADKARKPLVERIAAISRELRGKAQPGGRDVSRDEIDALWGH
ncbi:MAG: type II toxin-antitoxin system VapB family antitoxin [Hyphomicrobiales bacterium]|nr:type II toxin-antitoxin system VapB family antitoxin [Hyphomicrobiales bacterium]MDE2115059.1 type II toxin-antitoxin system VapB family antitoxin [Hyphomicrobiales bacterium]